MTVALTEEMQQMKSMIRNFVEKEVEPYAQQIEEEDAIPDHLVEKGEGVGSVWDQHSRGVRWNRIKYSRKGQCS